MLFLNFLLILLRFRLCLLLGWDRSRISLILGVLARLFTTMAITAKSNSIHVLDCMKKSIITEIFWTLVIVGHFRVQGFWDVNRSSLHEI